MHSFLSSPARSLRRITAPLAAAALALLLPRAGVAATLAEDFASPPAASRPWCYWYWLNGQISREGITKDLEAMQRVGIGTALIGSMNFPDLPEGPAPVLSPAWFELTEHAIREGRRLGIDLGLFNCPGWSQSGGPWNGPAQSMRYLRWSETRVTGGSVFAGVLPAPATPWQDVAVVAMPVSAEDRVTMAGLGARVEAPGFPDAAARLVDGDPGTVVRFPANRAESSLTIRFEKAVTARSLTLVPARVDFKARVVLEAADAAGGFHRVHDFLFDRSRNTVQVGPVPYAPLVISFPDTTATTWRLGFSELAAKSPSAGLAEVQLSPAPRVDHVMEKQLAKMHPTPKPMGDAYLWDAPAGPAGAGPAPGTIIDLTDRLQPDGRLEWSAPAGDWVVLRVGMTPTGVVNHPASPAATGLEVDKMSRAAIRHHFDSFLLPVLGRLGADDRQALRYVVADSYETGSQNWTDGFAARFQSRYGYDPQRWLPVLTGRVVGDADRSDRFLWDLRRLVADSVADDYVGGLRELANEHGLKLWLENYGHWGFPSEFLRYGGRSDLIGGEFWIGGDLGDIEIRAASSAAHIYGKAKVFSEAFTSSTFFEYHPYALKARGDWAFTEGANHLVLHVYISQPDDTRRPGANAWFSTEFNRHNTWFESARTWIDYLRRCHVMLEHGRNVAQIAYFIGEDAPIMTGLRQPEPPPGYGFDFINAEVIETRLAMRDGRWVLPDGTGYDLLVLPPRTTMRPEVLRKLAQLVREGGVLYGPAPTRSPSLQDYPAADDEVRRLAADLWGGAGVGRGRVFPDGTLAAALAARQAGPDVSGIDPAKVLWAHRSSAEREVYFISNQTDQPLALAPVFRQPDGPVELWDAVTGTRRVTARHAAVADGTKVELALEPSGSIFVVFPQGGAAEAGKSIVAVQRDGAADTSTMVTVEPRGLLAQVRANGDYRFIRADGTTLVRSVTDLPAALTLEGPWQVAFPPRRDVPASREFSTLHSWTEDQNEAVKYFSGTATYARKFDLPAGWLAAGRSVELELGRVEVIADVSVNGVPVGTTWLPPYRLDVTSALRAGENRVEIKVTNLWRNRVIGDRKYPQGFPGGPAPKEFQSSVFTSGRLTPDTPLQPSGLLGPVRLVPATALMIGSTAASSPASR